MLQFYPDWENTEMPFVRSRTFLNYDLMRHFSAQLFKSTHPFPCKDFHQFLTPEGFQQLYQDFPTINFFEKHEGLERIYGQRPHNRYYLAYEKTIYDRLKREHGEGVVQHQGLAESWQEFIEELETSKEYKKFIQSLFGVKDFRVRYAWHIGVNASEVSPHRDAPEKIGTHIFYFNTDQDWDASWGGSLLVLGGKRTDQMNPDFSDFATVIPNQIVDNHSFLFRNTPEAWHGVEPLTCPEGKLRRLFNVIFEFPPRAKKSVTKRILKRSLSFVRTRFAGVAR